MNLRELKREVNAMPESRMEDNVFIHVDGEIYDLDSIDMSLLDRIDLNATETSFLVSGERAL